MSWRRRYYSNMGYHPLLLSALYDECQYNTARAVCFWWQQPSKSLSGNLMLSPRWGQDYHQELSGTTTLKAQISILSHLLQICLFLLHLPLLKPVAMPCSPYDSIKRFASPPTKQITTRHLSPLQRCNKRLYFSSYFPSLKWLGAHIPVLLAARPGFP